MTSHILETRGISKEFSGVRVLNDINIGIRPGEVFGILGENGAGKSTLLKILCGIYTPTEGELFLNGNPVSIPNPSTAQQLGISMIPQEFNLIETLSVFENVFLGMEIRRGGLLNKKAMREQTSRWLKELQTDLSPNATIAQLSVAQKQMVEIAKALVHDSRILIMDEPTTVLTQHEVEILFGLIERLKQKGVTMLFISHKLKEVKQICDRLLILRDGNLISVDEVKEITEHDMAKKMVGRELNQVFPSKSVSQDKTVLKVSGLNSLPLVNDIHFELKKGEVLGFAGLIGAGRTELAEAIMGLRRKQSGQIWVQGQEASIHSPSDALKYRLGYLSEDRKGRGLVLNFGIPENTTLISLKKYSRWILHKHKEREVTQTYVKQFDVRAASMNSELQYLSGGNQQKVYLAKWMDTNPEILILDEPTRGIDVNAKKEIYHFIHSLTEAGLSCIVISSELEELIGLCTRVLVMRVGRIVGEVTGEHINEEEIMVYAAGLHDERMPA